MELVCIDYLSLERSKSVYENILVITDHLSKYVQAIPKMNQPARTTTRVLYENFFVHFGFQLNYTVTRRLTLRERSSRSSVRYKDQ